MCASTFGAGHAAQYAALLRPTRAGNFRKSTSLIARYVVLSTFDVYAGL